MSDYQKNIRNFTLLSHIDHGKSTLADRLLELTGTIEKRKMREQFLDMMELEREKGITIKLQPVRMEYDVGRVKNVRDVGNVGNEQLQQAERYNNFNKRSDQTFILNLIDTPGHIDFSYEVSRSLAAVEGAVLLVDASQGIQAQTLANLNLARQQELVIIPVINKIDLAIARIEETEKEIRNILGDFLGGNPRFAGAAPDILKISAKNGAHVEQVLEAIIEKVPPPKGRAEAPLRALIFDSQYDSYKGIIAYVRLVDGQIKKGEKILMLGSEAQSEVIEVGFLKPDLRAAAVLRAGEIGYVATGLKEIEKCRVGDTITLLRPDLFRSLLFRSLAPKSFRSEAPKKEDPKRSRSMKTEIKPLPGYEEPRPMVLAGFYPIEGDDFDLLKNALNKLKLNDASLLFSVESSAALGRGFQCGFLGLLHLEIVSQRLKREYGLDLIITAPSVSYAGSLASRLEEPWVKLEIITPDQYLGQVMKLVSGLSAVRYKDTQYLGPEKVLLIYEAPLREIIMDFYDQLKSVTAGYASMAYEPIGYFPADLVKLDILVAGEKVEPFSRMVPKEMAYQEGRALVEKLKKAIPRHQFSIPVQAVLGSRVIARETIQSLRKDVIAGLYGGDYTRKRKLLEKQKKGKKRMKQFGRVSIPQEVFLEVLKR